MKFYDFEAIDIAGKNVSMESFKGKTIVVVNTASKCGLTPQYKGLERLYQKYKDQGLVILGFPCNQFGGQEPGSEEEIQQGCLLNYGVSFPMFSKIKVNGKNAHPLFEYLKKTLPGTLGKRIKWNFTKFLINSNGVPIKRFAPQASPSSMEDEILSLLTVMS